MLLFISLPIKILLNLQDLSRCLLDEALSDSISTGSKLHLSPPPSVHALGTGSHFSSVHTPEAQHSTSATSTYLTGLLS